MAQPRWSKQASLEHTGTQQERNMTNALAMISTRSALSAFAVSAIAGLALMAQTGSASAKSVLSCEAGSMRSVIECCETIVKRKGLPMWMKQSGRNCSSSAVCRGRASGRTPVTHAVAPARICRIAIQYPQDRTNGGNPNTGRGNPNGSPTHG
jgi:hypothetical protein